MHTEQFVMAYGVEQDRLRAILPDGFVSLRPVLRINAEMCGAVSGALMVLGLKYGHYESENNKQKQRAYAVATEFTKRFKELNGSIVCRDLLGYDLTKPDDFVCIADKNLFRTICPEMIRSAVEVLDGVMADFE